MKALRTTSWTWCLKSRTLEAEVKRANARTRTCARDENLDHGKVGGSILLVCLFVTILNPVSLYSWLVHFHVGLNASKYLCCSQIPHPLEPTVLADWRNCQIEQFYRPVKLEFEMVKGTQAVTSRESISR
jgi:hypothetical protein